MQELRVALIGDYSPSVTAHQAIPPALELASARHRVPVRGEWLPTASLEEHASAALKQFHAVWCVPGSPYQSELGALRAIEFAREQDLPFLGTCGGCQHAILEYARNVLGIRNAEHAESHPSAEVPLIAPLSCALVEVQAVIKLRKDSRLYGIYGRESIQEEYHCRYGLNPRLEHLLAGSPLHVAGRDAEGEVRAMELADRGFYLLLQFQPERSALRGELPPVVDALIAAALLRTRSAPTPARSRG